MDPMDEGTRGSKLKRVPTKAKAPFSEPIPARREDGKAPLLFNVIEYRVVGTVREGGNQHPVLAGFEVAAVAVAEVKLGESIEVEFTYGGHTFVARAEPTEH